MAIKERTPGGTNGIYSKMAAPQSMDLEADYGAYVTIPRGARRVTVDMNDNTQDFYVEVAVGATVAPDEHRAAGQTWYLGLEGDVLANDENDAAERVTIRIKWGTGGGPVSAKIQIFETVVGL